VIEGFTWVQVAVAVVAGLICVIVGLSGKAPADLTVGVTALVELLLVGQLVVALIQPALGHDAVGSVLEFYIYIVSALLIPPAAVFWALIERGRWSTVILGVGCLAVAVMVYRMQQIWGFPVA
jgi:hypothetical protein